MLPLAPVWLGPTSRVRVSSTVRPGFFLSAPETAPRIDQSNTAPMVLFFELISSVTYGLAPELVIVHFGTRRSKPMRGRKPLPSNLVRLRGNPGKRRLDDAEPVPAPGVPTCASCLGDEATKDPGRRAHHPARR